MGGSPISGKASNTNDKRRTLKERRAKGIKAYLKKGATGSGLVDWTELTAETGEQQKGASL